MSISVMSYPWNIDVFLYPWNIDGVVVSMEYRCVVLPHELSIP